LEKCLFASTSLSLIEARLPTKLRPVKQCTSYDYGQRSTFNALSAIERARTLLESSLTSTGEDIRTVATQFEKLAGGVETILALTSAVVDCVQEDWVQSIVPMARMLDAAARRFIAKRVESVTAIGTVFAGEADMIEKLLTLTGEQRSIAREGKALGVLASIEVGRLGADGRCFGYMARELDEFSVMGSAGAEEVRSEAAQRRASLINRRHKFNVSLQRAREHFSEIESEMSGAIKAMESALVQLAHIPADFQECVAAIAADISRVVEAVQLQDVTRQQCEHVRDALIRVSGEIADCDGQVSDLNARSSLILKIQTLQIESARTSTEGWAFKINRCLESILHVSSSDVVAIGARILVQERGLSTQLARIEHLEHECEADDAEIEACLAGLGDLMRITKTHLERSRFTRDRMRLLNFNSMIEARHLGSQATAVLEITRNIGRISTGWSALTDRSGDTLNAMLTSSARAEEAHRRRTRVSMDDLGNARKQSQAGLRALFHAASVANSNGKKIEVAVAALHSEIAMLACVADRLMQSVAILSEARSEIEQVGEFTSFSTTELNESDFREIEADCAASYTSELERRILRAALFGEAMPLEGAAETTNDIELF
jgi:hypothetical protein